MTRTPSAQIKHIAARARPSSAMDSPASDDGVWIYSFGDLMSLLLIFFVMLYAISNISEESFNAFKEAMKTTPKKRESVQQSKAIAADWANDTIAGIPVSVLRKAAEQAGPFAPSQMQAVIGHIQARLKAKSPKSGPQTSQKSPTVEEQVFNTKYQTFTTPQTQPTPEILTIRIDEALLWTGKEAKLSARGQSTLVGLISDFDSLPERESLEIAMPTSKENLSSQKDEQRLWELRRAIESWFESQPERRDEVMPRVTIATFWPSEAEQRLQRHLRVRLSRQNRADAIKTDTKTVPPSTNIRPTEQERGVPK